VTDWLNIEAGSEVGVSPIIDEIYHSKIVRDQYGNQYDLSSEVDSVEGNYLYQLITSDKSITRTLEIGCAYGLSSLHICEALRGRRNASHIIIDPKQISVWHGVGVSYLEQAGIDFFRLIQEPSELALPDLLRTQEGEFDLVFIDGWHTFDHTMLDLFYANRLVRVGGYVVIDDCNWESVSAAVSYYNNYAAFEQVKNPALGAYTWRQRVAKDITTIFRPRLARMVLPASIYSRIYRRMSFSSMVAFSKVSEDNRSWTWFMGF
jgi:predicted O-methyltransferase YrrM